MNPRKKKTFRPGKKENRMFTENKPTGQVRSWRFLFKGTSLRMSLPGGQISNIVVPLEAKFFFFFSFADVEIKKRKTKAIKNIISMARKINPLYLGMFFFY